MNPNNSGLLMEPILLIVVPIALLLGGAFLFSFIRGAFQGQWDDLDTPPQRLVEPDHQEQKQ